jgi:hypothetical protein
MASAPTPYVPAHPGDLITAEAWNSMQLKAQQDIAAQIAAAIAGVKTVDHANDADTLSHKNLDAITQYILDQVFAQLPKRTGYMQYFCNLRLGADPSKIIKHGLKAYPLVDVYQLEYFPAVCAKDDTPAETKPEWVLFYLYHGDERRVHGVDIESDDPTLRSNPPFRVLWKTLIDQMVENKQLQYTDDTTLDDLELDFWKALFTDPNGRFDPDATCHSPWFEKCCGEKRSVADLTRHGDFDDIWLKVKPVKTINWAATSVTGRDNASAQIEPSNVRVAHLDTDTLMVQLLGPINYNLPATVGGVAIASPQPADFTNYLPVMLLLKV